jgi:hypothetical protein
MDGWLSEVEMADCSGRLIDELAWHHDVWARPIVRLDGAPLVAFEHIGERVVTQLAFMDGGRYIDITVQPGAAVQLVRGAAIRRRRDPNAWERVVSRRLAAVAIDWGVDDLPLDRDRLTPTLVALGFPLVRMALLRGALPPPHIPRWAEPVLACADVRAAAISAFGADASRRVIRTLPSSLLGDTTDQRRSLALLPLAMAMALRGLVGPDDMANVMAAPSADHQPRNWPTVDQLVELRRGFSELGRSAAIATAMDALTAVDGPARLMLLAPQIRHLRAAAGGPPPMSLADLDRAVADLHYSVPEPAVPRAAPAIAPATRRWRCEFDYPAATRRIDGVRTGDHHLTLPRSQADLQAWGRQLHNCIAEFAPAVAAGRSVVVGLHRGERLVAALELDPGLGRVRQFVRHHNQRPLAPERHALDRMLRHLGIAEHANSAIGDGH